MGKRKADTPSEGEEEEEEEQAELTHSDASDKPKKKSKDKAKSKTKRVKTTEASEEEGESSGVETSSKKKKPKAKGGKGVGDNVQVNDQGEHYLDLGKKKRVTVRDFKGSTLIDIREYYGAGDEEKPGKKGIALSVEQWQELSRNVSEIDALVAKSK